MTKPIFILELSEFNDELLHQAIKQLALPNIEKVLGLKRSLYKTDDRYNSGYLEPWIQWASIHTGIPAKVHKTKNQLEMPNHFPAVWEKLAEEGISQAIWGSITASLSPEQTQIFVPNVWQTATGSYPKSLKLFSKFGHYIAANQLQFSKFKANFNAWLLLIKLWCQKQKAQALIAWQDHKKEIEIFGAKPFVYLGYYERCSTLGLLSQIKKSDPQVVFFTLNLLSYLQQHFWFRSDKEISEEIKFGLKNVDAILGLIFDALPGLTFVMHNGLSQLPLNLEKSFCDFRAINLSKLLIDLSVPFLELNENYHPFWRISFTCEAHFDEAYKILKDLRIKHKPLFKLETSTNSDKLLFIRLNIQESVSEETMFGFEDKFFNFYDYFVKANYITSRRVPMGTIYSNEIEFPDHIYNHDFNRYLLNHLLPHKYTIPQHVISLDYSNV